MDGLFLIGIGFISGVILFVYLRAGFRHAALGIAGSTLSCFALWQIYALPSSPRTSEMVWALASISMILWTWGLMGHRYAGRRRRSGLIDILRHRDRSHANETVVQQVGAPRT